jgi:hypothetical protein
MKCHKQHSWTAYETSDYILLLSSICTQSSVVKRLYGNVHIKRLTAAARDISENCMTSALLQPSAYVQIALRLRCTEATRRSVQLHGRDSRAKKRGPSRAQKHTTLQQTCKRLIAASCTQSGCNKSNYTTELFVHPACSESPQVNLLLLQADHTNNLNSLTSCVQRSSLSQPFLSCCHL